MHPPMVHLRLILYSPSTDILFNAATAIGEHTDLLTEVKKWTTSLAEAEDCLKVLDTHFYVGKSK